MAIPRIEERTLYPPLIHYLDSIGFKAIGETKVVKKHPDILFQADSISFVIEIKIGKPEVGLQAVAQASDYARKLGTQNIIILIYPEKFRNQIILDPEIVSRIALNEKVTALVLTEYWTESLDIEPCKLFEQLKQRIQLKEIKVDFRTIVRLIERYVKDLNAIVYQIKTEELISEVVDKLDLFSSIGEIKDKETAKKQVINLASYLLFNQLLFYHIYKRKSGRKELPELEEIGSIDDLQRYFDKITNIDYQSIYRVNILGHIPNKKVVVDTLNEVIKAIKLLRAEHITSDLAGRFFHDLIPYEVRKVLAAFYTHPVAAEILAGLTIDSWDETVIDPACGSGTLLVAAYKRKMDLYRKLYGYRDIDRVHKQFIENDLTGIDIMPFAAHISTINLATQNIEHETNIVRIGTRDSLELVESLKSVDFRKKGIEIKPYTETIQKTLFGYVEKTVRKKGAIGPEGKGFRFYIKPVDVVIMNPPFSDREKMPPEMREKLKKNPLGEICGHQVNLWGYFLALADLILKPGGKIGAVIPMNIARGKATEKIRKHLLENYHIKYFVKPIGDVAFSEGASFMDILLIAQKTKPRKDDLTGVIFLKKSIRSLTIDDVDTIVDKIRSISKHGLEYTSNDFDIVFLRSDQILDFKENLMPFLGVFKPHSIKVFEEFNEKVKKIGKKKITKLENLTVREGFHASPAGLSELTFITGFHTKARTKRAFLILDKEDERKLITRIGNTDMKFEIKKSKVIPALRTLTGVDTFFVKNIDYFIEHEPEGLDRLLQLSKWKNKDDFDWKIVKEKLRDKKTYLAVARRFRPDSVNTHFFAFYNDEEFVVPHTFKIIKIDKVSSKYQCLFLNSIIGLVDLIMFREQTTEGYTDIMESELNLFRVFNIEGLTRKDVDLLVKIFDKLKNVKFPSILEQLENRFWARVELDKTILKILGFSNKEINEWLPKVYDALVEELKAMKEVR